MLDLSSLSLAYLFVTEEYISNSHQSLHRPRHKPIDTAVVYQSGEVPTPGPEGFPYRRHGQDYMEIICTLGDEILPDSFPGRGYSLLCGFISHLTDSK